MNKVFLPGPTIVYNLVGANYDRQLRSTIANQNSPTDFRISPPSCHHDTKKWFEKHPKDYHRLLRLVPSN